MHSSVPYKVQQTYWIPNLLPNNTDIHTVHAISKLMSQLQRIHKYNMMNVYIQLKVNTVISQCMEQGIVTKLSNTSTKPKPPIMGTETC